MSAANRVRFLVFHHGPTVAVVLAVVGVALLSGAAWVLATPPTDTVSERVDVQTVSADSETSAVVTGNSTAYERGERLRNLPVYFQRISPVLTVAVETSTPGGVDTRVTQRLVLIQEASRDGQPFFATNRTLVEETETVSDGNMRTATDVNVTEVRQEANRIQEDFGSVGAYQVTLALAVEYRTDRYEGTLSARTPLTFTSNAYWLGGSLSDSREHARTVTRQETEPANPAVYGGLGLLALLAFGGAGAVVYARRGIDAEAVETEFFHEEYRGWISEGEFPTGTSKRYVSINTLEDLVDIAIDSNKRVIFDPTLEVYAVVDGDLVYYFSTDPFNIDVWLDT